MSIAQRHLKDPSALAPNLAALAYSVVTYLGGWWLMASTTTGVALLGTVLCAHGMVIAAYLLHDCAHHALFRQAQHNARLGGFLNAIAGANYGHFDDVRRKHMRHHVSNADPVSFDYRSFLLRHPRVLRFVVALEWAYIPAVEILMHAMLLVAPFYFAHKQALRSRIALLLGLRLVALLLLAVWSFQAVLLYALAVLLQLTVLRFMDAFQHSYVLSFDLDSPNAVFPHKGDTTYEQANTYSNLLSQRWPWLNLLVLNFCYHNVHHDRPTASWCRLPRLHQQLIAEKGDVAVSFSDQLRCFHRNRLRRILSVDEASLDARSDLKNGTAVGANALSFLTAF